MTASDLSSFQEQKIPAVHFFTGPNLDYHKVTDTSDKINFEGMTGVLHFVEETASNLADREEKLIYTAQSNPSAARPASAAAPPRRVSLGTVPDMGRDSGGVLLAGVMPGSPAEKAGLQKGDLLIRLGDNPIDTLSDLAEALRGHQPGDSVEVVVKRGTDEIHRRVQLAERK